MPDETYAFEKLRIAEFVEIDITGGTKREMRVVDTIERICNGRALLSNMNHFELPQTPCEMYFRGRYCVSWDKYQNDTAYGLLLDHADEVSLSKCSWPRGLRSRVNQFKIGVVSSVYIMTSAIQELPSFEVVPKGPGITIPTNFLRKLRDLSSHVQTTRPAYIFHLTEGRYVIASEDKNYLLAARLATSDIAKPG